MLIITKCGCKGHKTCDEPSSTRCICFNGFSAPQHSGYTMPVLKTVGRTDCKKSPIGF